MENGLPSHGYPSGFHHTLLDYCFQSLFSPRARWVKLDPITFWPNSMTTKEFLVLKNLFSLTGWSVQKILRAFILQ